MIEAPSFHAIAAMVLTVGVFIAFARGRVSTEIISLLTIVLIAVFLYFYRHISEEDRKQLFHQEKSAEEPKKKDDDAVRDNQ